MPKAHDIFNRPEILEQLKALMKAADSAILDIYHSDNFGAELKGDNSPVTKADLAAHNVLIQGLCKITPDIPVVSEEDASSVSIPSKSNVYWLIDPLDGTKEFIKRNDEFTCNLALIEDNRATLGFVSIPAKEELYFGGKELGAFRKSKDLKATQIQHTAKAGVTRVVASKSHLNTDTKDFISQLAGTVELVQAGSSLKFLKIATGEADLYPRLAPTCEWDTAAAHAVLEGAGGKVLQASNLEPVVYGKSDILNPHFIASSN